MNILFLASKLFVGPPSPETPSTFSGYGVPSGLVAVLLPARIDVLNFVFASFAEGLVYGPWDRYMICLDYCHGESCTCPLNLGRDICELQIEKRYGEKVIELLSKDLRNVIPDATGLTPVNLYYCKRFYQLYSQVLQKVPQVVEKSIIDDKDNTFAQKVPQVVELFKPLHGVEMQDNT